MSWTKKHGTPLHTGKALPADKEPWDVTIAKRIEAKDAAIAAGTYEPPPRQCHAMTSGRWGPKRQCENSAIKGGAVCRMHGGSIKHTRDHANRMLLAEVEPTIGRLIELRDQDEDKKVALGAAVHISNRILGDKKDTGLANKARTIIIGVNLGGLPDERKKQLALPEGETFEGEVVGDNEPADSFRDPLLDDDDTN